MLEEFYNSLRFALKDLIIFPGTNLIQVLRYSLMIAIFSTTSAMVGIEPLLNIIGAWTGVAILTIAYFISGIGNKSDVGEEEVEEDDNNG